jgi:hypothetical protein
VTLLGELIRINCSFGSLGLNLASEGLLLGMQKGGRKETPMRLYLMHGTFTNVMTINTLIPCVAGRGSHAQRWFEVDLCQYHDRLHLRHSVCRKGPTRSEVRPTPTGAEVPSRWRSQVTRGPLEGSHPGSGHVSVHDWWGTEISVNTKRP